MLTGIELTASIVHEINQSIAVLLTQGAAAINWLDRDPPDVREARNSVEATVRSAERIAEVVQKLRELMANKPLGSDLVDLNEVVRNAVGLSQQVAAFGRHNLYCDLTEDLPLVRGDRVQLEMVLLNLLANAVEAMQASSRGAGRLKIRTYADEWYVCVTVADSGPGIRPGAEVFRLFYSTKAKGLGIGLSICRSVIAAHRGTITAKNREAGGAVFELRIPTGERVKWMRPRRLSM